MSEKKRYLGYLANDLCVDKQAFIDCYERLPEFYDRISSLVDDGASIDDETVYRILLDIYEHRDQAERYNMRYVRHLLNRLHTHLTGLKTTWDGRDKTTTSVRPIALQEGFTDMDGFLELISKIRPAQQRAILYSQKLMTIIKENGYANLEQVYDGFRKFFYPMRPSDGLDYRKFREVARDFSRVMHDDPSWWTRDYKEHKPSRNQ